MATAADVNGMYGVRSELNARGVNNDRIGWNQNTGYVTVDGQNFIKPQTNVEGTTYTDPTQFNQAYNVYDTSQKLNTAQQGVEQQLANPAVNPYDQQVNDALAQYYQKLASPTPYDVYGSPEYVAYQAQSQRQAEQGIRAAQESMGAAGFGRSTNLAERAQGIQNDQNEYLNTQVVPQLQAAHTQQQQQEIANLGAYLGALTGQQAQFDTRTQQGLSNTMDFMGYLSGQRNQFANEQYQTGRDAVADQQYQQNYDRGVLESDRAYEAQQAQQEWDNMFAQSQFNEQKAAQLWDQAFQEKNFQQQIKEAAANRGLDWASLKQREKEQLADEEFRQKQLDLQQAQFDAEQSAPPDYDYKTDPSFSDDISWINSNPTKAVAEIRSSAQDLIAQYGYSGYQELLKAAEAAEPDDQDKFIIPQ